MNIQCLSLMYNHAKNPVYVKFSSVVQELIAQYLKLSAIKDLFI